MQISQPVAFPLLHARRAQYGCYLRRFNSNHSPQRKIQLLRLRSIHPMLLNAARLLWLGRDEYDPNRLEK